MLQIRVLDYSDPSWRSHICEEYLEGNMVVIKNFRPEHIDFDTLEELASINFNTLSDKSAKSTIECPQLNKIIKSSRGQSFHQKAINEMQKLDQCVAKDVFAGLLTNIFKDKIFEGLMSSTTWRFTEMKDMDYHSDIYRAATLRCFYNLSTSNRIWRLGHNTYDIYNHLSKEKKLQLNDLLHKSAIRGYIKSSRPAILLWQREINSMLNEITENKIVEPLFTWEFCKYDLWIVDGRKAAHKPVWGDKLVAFDYMFVGNNLLDIKDTSLCYPKWISERINLQ